MFEGEIFTDCVIKIGEDSIKTHRCILASNSKVFQKMFEHDGMIEAQNVSKNNIEGGHRGGRIVKLAIINDT
ncbi:unnamed protein product [Meloidogyne enterolobii]|uniref:Uncharacterized protein n=1 Tax=Meloidogyne enterolobii TaxID=390850 RepID=A0ACB0YPP3_MELEN